MTDTTPRPGGVTGPGPHGATPARSGDGPSRLLAGARGRLRVLTDAPARTWLRTLAHVTLILVFLLWGLTFAVGAESMYLVSRHVGQGPADSMAVASVLLTLLGAGVLLARHRRPELVAAAVTVLAASSLVLAGATNGYELAIGAALFAVAAARPPRRAWVVATAVVVPVLVLARITPLVTLVGSLAAGAAPDDPGAVPRFLLPGRLGELVPPWWIVTALPVVVLALLGVAFGTLVRTARLRNAALAEAAAARAAEDEQRARATQADERARVAREMHDVIAHSITVMIALGGGAAAALDRSPDQARRALDELVDTGRGALEDVRRILGVLHAPDDGAPGPGVVGAGVVGAPDRATGDDGSTADVPMAPQPGVEDLAHLVDRFRTAGLPVRTAGLAVAGLDGLDATVQLAVYRVVQESLTNTLRHAPGTACVDVEVRRVPGAVEVVVTDQGAGARAGAAPTAAGSGRGIVGMTGRVAAFGGTLDAGPHGPGWRVRAVLPQADDAHAGTAPPSPPTEGEA
ncbi:sensor histidine kinase [Cellulomonas phragmiteti]|uniref:histidine kinase n=1 Tax=Cellulomonas phragmiteti TaxID=478780 RepID=A0ABQ4DMU1_9CELL|nr:histidine kinase [Cellulomonas phragmiteti]GIG40664.1 hypothetical protein Cph01nite_24260 [Cellulomonas phragmiteti]